MRKYFFLVFLLFCTMFLYSQNITQTIQMSCTNLTVEGQDYSRNVSHVDLAIFDTGTTLIRFTFHNGNTTHYHLTNQRRVSNNQIESNVVVRSGGQSFSGFTGLATESPGLMNFTIYQGPISASNRYASMTLRVR